MSPETSERGINLFYLILSILFGLAALFAHAVWWPLETPQPVSVVDAPSFITDKPEKHLLALQTSTTSSSTLPITQSTSTILALINKTPTGSTSSKKVADTGTQTTGVTVKNTPVDRLSPTTPSNLIVRSVSHNQIVVSWNPSTDNRGVAGYAIYQDSALIGTTVKTVQGFIRLTPSKKYTFGVAAFDSAGNFSNINNILVTTSAKPAPVVSNPPPTPSPTPVSTPLPPPSPSTPNLCGNGTQDRGEECDDGNTNNNDMCTNQCKAARCMDGIVNYVLEQCDDGNEVDNDWCDNQCHNHVPVLKDVVTPNPSPNPTPPPPAGSFTLLVTKSGSGTITSSPSGITCGATCGANYTSGTNVVLTASPSSGYVFSGWNGACTGSGTTCTVSMTATKSVSATFTGSGGGTPTTYTVNVTSAGNYSPTSLTLNSGDSIKFVYTPPISNEVVTRFTPSTISSLTLDSEFTNRTKVFSSPGTWTFKADNHNGNTGTVTVQ